MDDLSIWQTVLAFVAHERVAEKTGRCSWNEIESARLASEPGSYPLPMGPLPPWLVEWCWP